ncbi:hypothetical protein DFQ11_10368 [Winogradskyella epiphytica]|uniref:DUF6268 domain-containing protein n=1 Tax=Winogradskyella epiphytica TaxID=262005 RepID=A0A2V4XYQ1_9FLAO|nr:DUF6268 family outer membrane beta-barrel protein [Winogradskyella epiphytica]PYE80988.1 hypothetical protein DFQ11_10368 [Winogradskyella epiphytica]GGW66019.1 hypothetical protein GCM10008085_17310 [Winogradskyella epiphytica]
MNLKTYRVLFIVLALCFSQLGLAQLTDLARLEYSFIPKSKSGDQYTRLRALVNYPIELKKDNYLVIGGEYNRVILNLEDNYPFDNSQLETINIIDLNIAYTFKTSEFWRFGAKINPRIASTLNETITMDDLFLNGGVYAINDRTDDETAEKPYRLILGLTYNSTTGIPYPLPFVSYFRRLNDNWSYNLGVPKSNAKYFFNEENIVQAFVGLDGYFAHLQRPIIINGKQADHVSLSVAVGGLGYEHYFTKHLVLYVYSGYTFRLNNILRNEDKDEVYKLDDRNAFYLRTGLKFKL